MIDEFACFSPPPKYSPPPKRSLPSKLVPAFFQKSKLSEAAFPPSSIDIEKSLASEGTSGPPPLQRASTWRFLPECRFWTLIDDWWLWEIISWTFAALCLIAMVILLGIYTDRPTPSWPCGLTLNACVSILGAFAKAALLLPTAEALGQLKFTWFAQRTRSLSHFRVFDQASRGPWGSLVLIFTTRGRALAAFGASIVVLSIALDPFFQQLLVYPNRLVNVGHSSITRARIYSASLYAPSVAWINGGSFTFEDWPAQYYIEQSLYYNNTPQGPEVPADCPTGNCTWPAYESLGACSVCTDVSYLLQYACLRSENDWMSNITNGSAGTYAHGNACGYFLNSTTDRPMLMTGYGTSTNNNETLLGRFLSLNLPPPSGRTYYDNRGSLNFLDLPDPIWDAIAVFTPGAFEGVRSNATPVALECNLHWCIQTIQSEMRGARLHETVLSTFRNKTNGDIKNSWSMSDGAYEYDGIPRITSPSTGVTFGASTNASALTMAITFLQTAFSFATAESAEAAPLFRYTVNSSPDVITIPYVTTPWYNANNITAQFERIAHTTSDLVRAVSNGTDPVVGIAWGPVSYVEVRWAWLAFPLALLVFGLIFLLAAIRQSHISGVEVWKTSVLAVLLHGLHGGAGDYVGNDTVPVVGRSRTECERFQVRLRGKKGGRWRFSKRISRSSIGAS